MEIIFVALVFSGMGLLFIVIGILVMAVWNKRRQKAVMNATAHVADVERRRNGKGNTYYYPVFEYYAGGLMRRVTSSFGSNPGRYQIGEEVELLYNPDKPEQFWSERDAKMMKLVCGIFIGFGVFFLIMGIFLLIKGIF